MITTRISATGACVPEQIITNDDHAKIVDTSDEWITQRTGIKERYFAQSEKIEEMAELAGLSKNYFGFAFKKALGETPHSYLIKIRI